MYKIIVENVILLFVGAGCSTNGNEETYNYGNYGDKLNVEYFYGKNVFVIAVFDLGQGNV